MTNKEFNTLILTTVSKALSSDKNEIEKNLLSNIEEDKSADEKYARMFLNSVECSVTKSVEYVLDILEELQVINPQNIEMSSQALSALNIRRLK